ncbi:lysine-specific demethylase 2B-like, partial [Scyliorhinus torazame]|uniref:lysine-specific demethylase 2B-like n=1 Tax=Scyliorhinus torazame TaxID=75743 RepID=UPI003B5B93C7
WIHAVYTPEDTLVFGGNFLHSFNIPTQLRIHSIEDRTRVPSKFRYPFYFEMCWYVIERYVFFLTKFSHLTKQFQRESQLIDEGTESDNTENGDDVKEEDDTDDGSERGRIHQSDVAPADRNGLLPDMRVPAGCSLKRSPSSESLDSGAGSVGSQDSPADHWIHLTHFEHVGLQSLLDKLQSLPDHKKCVPSGLQHPEALLCEMQKVLEDHMNDDPKLACSGFPIVRWPKRRDKPILPHTALCMICEEVGQNAEGESNRVRGALMECSACSEIVHPACLKMNISMGIISKELPNCWECPKCVRQERNKLALMRKGLSAKDNSEAARQRHLAELFRKREEHSRRIQAIEAARRRLEVLTKRKKFDYLLLRKKRLAAAEHNARKKIKFEREQILLRT